MPNIRTLLSHLRSSATSEREKGTYFERVALSFMKNDPGMTQEYDDAWTFQEWASLNGVSAVDTGVDLVARIRDGGGYCAVQCKFYREDHVIQKGDIDSFFTASGKSAFSRRLIIDTTVAPWGKNARDALDGQQIETTRIGLDRFEDSPIDWAGYVRDGSVGLAPRKAPRPHQLDAMRCTREGFETHDRGKLIMACGTGKTFTGLKIAEDLAGVGKHVLFLVPSLSLMSQSVREWTIDTALPLRSFAVCSDAQVGRRRKDNDDIAEIDIHDLDYWETWASDIAEIAKTHVTRIDAVVRKDGSAEQAAFQRFLAEIRDDLNDSITEAEAVEMLAQHIITRPVFEALFQDHSFAANNPVSRAMQSVLDVLQAQNLEKEAESLQRFYDSVRRRAAGIDSAEAKQRIVIELYDKFFRTAFPRMTEKLGIVYTPVEIVDFIIRSVDDTLRSEFELTLGSPGVHIVDPFTGTGTFITRLLQSGLIKPEELSRKYREELHANEIVLLAYYIAAINIEAVYSTLSGSWEPFGGICLTDTFQLYEQDRDLLNDLMVDNSSRRTRQKALDVRVVLGNPPYSAQQGSENENNKNLDYPSLDRKIRETYAKASASKLAKANYDSYVRAIRWASDRVQDRGVIAFVTNGSFIDAKNLDGLRKTLVEEFSSISIFDLRGDQRTAGEASRREGGKVFGSGSRTPVAITVLIKNPDRPGDGTINYFDIGDYLTREEKLAAIAKAGSSSGIAWSRVTPNAEGDWINQRDPAFQAFLPLAERDGRDGGSVFQSNSFGVITSRDPWVYASSPTQVEQRARKLIAAYNEETARYQDACEGLSKDERPALEAVVSSDPHRISWSRALKKDAERGKRIAFDAANIVPSAHRPFVRQFLYFDRRVNEMVNLTKRMFPSASSENLVITCTGVTDRKGFSCLVTDQVPNMHLTDTNMCYPRFVYETPDQKTKDLFADTGGALARRDGVTDWALRRARDHYQDPSISKDDLFWYVYGVLHSPEYRRRFDADLQKVHPRLPFAADFRAFSDAGRTLGQLHLNFDTLNPYPVSIAQGDLRLARIDDPEAFFRVEQMRFAGKRGGIDRSVIHYNGQITVTGVPLEAYDYVVNGKSAIEWVMERQGVASDKPSGIVNDANRYAVEVVEDPAYPLKLLQSVITASVETVRIVKALPSLDIACTASLDAA